MQPKIKVAAIVLLGLFGLSVVVLAAGHPGKRIQTTSPAIGENVLIASQSDETGSINQHHLPSRFRVH